MTMYLKVLAVSFVIVAVQHLTRLLYIMGFHRTIYNHVPGPCSLVPGIDMGSEDMEILPGGLALISTGYKDSIVHEGSSPYLIGRQGKILLYDIENKTYESLTITRGLNLDDFGPHGISVWIDTETGDITLFVVNHPPGGDTVEIFDFIPNDKQLRYRQTIRDRRFASLNSVVATSDNSFYVTNFLSVESTFQRHLHLYLMLPFGNIIHYDGDTTMTMEAAGGFFMSNGIAFSNDKKFIYLNVFQELRVLQVLSDNKLMVVKVVPLYTNPDNVLVERETGDVYLGCHPRMGDMAEHLKNNSLPAASQILQVRFDEENNADITEMFSDDGKFFSGVTVGARYKNHLLIGSAIKNMLHCEVRVP